jgi:MFS transporter, AAHS family, 4-hydroxybenzoate transporter
VCAYTIPHYGWRIAFMMAGVISLLMLLLVYFFVTDSLDFLIRKQPANALVKVNGLLKKMHFEPFTFLPIKPDRLQKVSPLSLFNSEYRDSTIKSWIAVFFGFLTLYTLMSWVPNIAKETGLPLNIAIYVGVALNAGAAIGSASVGALGSKFGLRQTIFTFMICAFAVMMLYGNVSWSSAMLFMLIFMIGVFVQGGFNGLWPTLSRIYPSDIRTTGVGYAFGLGRLGAITGPALFGFLSDIGFTTALLFSLFSFPLLISGFCVYSLKSKNLIISDTKYLIPKPAIEV